MDAWLEMKGKFKSGKISNDQHPLKAPVRAYRYSVAGGSQASMSVTTGEPNNGLFKIGKRQKLCGGSQACVSQCVCAEHAVDGEWAQLNSNEWRGNPFSGKIILMDEVQSISFLDFRCGVPSCCSAASLPLCKYDARVGHENACLACIRIMSSAPIAASPGQCWLASCILVTMPMSLCICHMSFSIYVHRTKARQCP